MNILPRLKNLKKLYGNCSTISTTLNENHIRVTVSVYSDYDLHTCSETVRFTNLEYLGEGLLDQAVDMCITKLNRKLQ